MDIDPAEPAPARAEPTVHEAGTPGELAATAADKSGANGTAADQPVPPVKTSRTGRNLPVAIGVGAGLLFAGVASLSGLNPRRWKS